ncbi:MULTISPECIES: ABC transporter ATP-binding protein [Chryseobacterium]|jgi:subfamily B ATP-binding cassette protein MsbA|uniref:ABC transporter ATP-binding protein n=1 Tax=Chryseobacterium indoltheticum TaxID=254 RepID=A0A381F744_9FLAO|nr:MULTISPECIES: ABC transporter ATP-binding protein [Chryseobacterium]AZA61602.1 ABC transporter ATP-binding protein [Chryseobacterium indoltheticum]AZA72749.1 ABC transporter ATP-binding protein [Chryseobacterium indoltheticum]MDF2833410.1 transporter ATP-binding protein [Chryseobacterium indoltheticum]MDQ8143915.1 ABC transporter ATP-binding protein [Chryseobacterium sp. CFS15]QQQ26862.1 ABC transporter ATP-binding protein [Chryseobacterium indoltheticum]
MNEYKKILRFARPHQKYIYGSLFFNLLYSVFQIASLGTILPVLGMLFGTIKRENFKAAPVYSGDLVDLFSYLKKYSNYYIQTLVDDYGTLNVLAWLCVITAFMFLLRNIFRYLGSFLLINYRVGVTKDLRGEMYRKVLSLPVSFFTDSRKGDMMSRMSNDVGEVEGNILGSLVDLINAPFMLISTLISLFWLSSELTLFSLLVLPVMGTMIALIGKSLKKDSHEAQNEMGTIFSIVDETLKSSKVIKIFSAEKIMDNRFMGSMQKWINSSIRLGRKKELASPISEFLGSVTFLIIAWYGGKQIIVDQSIAPEDFLVFLGMFFQILPPVKSLSASISNVQKGEASLHRVLEILDADVKIEEIAEPVSISNLNTHIHFKDIGFYYDKSNLILKNFNLIIPKGKTVALVGQSGSGKTTIANLLARFYDVSEGQILIDETDIKHLKLTEYRKLLGMVTQESVLFNDTVYNNILMGKPEATRDEVIAAAKIANADHFISQLPNGYDTNIGDDGGKLSGGQKQRVSIARAVLKNPPIMILDEATSALDTESEKFVQDALEKMMENRTSLVIAHRLSTIQKADWIVVMEKGDIVEQGSHQELMARRGTYHKLVELQNFD